MPEWLRYVMDHPVVLTITLAGLALIICGSLALAVERLTRPNPGYRRRHAEGGQEGPAEVRLDQGNVQGWRTQSGSWRAVVPEGREKHHRAEGGPRDDTRPLHPGYYTAGRARVFRRPPSDPED